MLQGGVTLLRQGRDQITNHRSHTSHYLNAGRAAEAYLLKGQAQKVFPAGIRNDEPQPSAAVAHGANLQASTSQTQQVILNLIERLNGGGGIVYRRRQRLDCDVDEQAKGVLRILVKGAIQACFERPLPGFVFNELVAAKNA